MIRFALLSLVVLAATLAAGQDLPLPRLKAASLPIYPLIARQARIEGEVKVNFTLNPQGEVVTATAVSGHPMLKVAALENVKTWRFDLPQDLFRTNWEYSSVFVFRISKNLAPSRSPKLTVVLDSFEQVEVVTNPSSDGVLKATK